jgi:beta-glucosidase
MINRRENMKHENIIKKMTLEQKIALCSGKTFWKTKDYPELNIPSLFLSDGPHGLRKQEGEADHLGLNASKATTCFPTASAVAATWDLDLVKKMGEAIGQEAVKIGVNVVLGPGTNMKRNPLCGRNFEYFSEDPFLSGKLSAAWINGVQSTGTGVSLKHFALNNQELKRMSTDVRVDERALREYYLPGFEIAVKEANPATLMCAYNMLEGTYCSDNKRLLWDILREEWGFKGAVMTDWGAMNDRIEAFKAGLDLEMPGSQGRFDKEVKQAVEDGKLDEAYIDACVDRLLTLIERTTNRQEGNIPEDIFEKNHKLAYEVALAGGVLLKNEGNILPINKTDKIAVIGKLAEVPRYQGTGSSLVSPTKLISLLEAMKASAENVDYSDGYTINDKEDRVLMDKAVQLAASADKVVLCIGLTDIFESEGFDRLHMRIPSNQISLLKAVAAVNSKVIVVMVGGSAIEMPWENDAKGILHMQLSGQAGGEAASDLLFGKASPCGKLTETYPIKYEDVINSSYYGMNPKQTPYLESMYCGYRYFSTAKKAVRYPFGFGLSYTQFEYSDMKVIDKGDYNIEVTANITNTGNYQGAEVAQVYVEAKTEGVYRPFKELKGFAKVSLKPGEIKQMQVTLDKRSFAIYDEEKKNWVVESGSYRIQVGANSEDMRLETTINLEGIEPKRSSCSTWYYTLKGIPTKADFLTIHKPYPEYVKKTKGTYDLTCSVKEMMETSLVCKLMYKGMEGAIAKQSGGKVDYSNASFKMLMDSASDNPLKSMPLFSPDSMPLEVVTFIVDVSNGHLFKGLSKLIKSKKEAKKVQKTFEDIQKNSKAQDM